MFETCATDQAKLDLRAGIHESGDDYMIALYLQADAPDANRSSVTYDPAGEISGSGYTPGGKSLTGFTRFVGKEQGASVVTSSTPESTRNAEITRIGIRKQYPGEVRDGHTLETHEIAFINFRENPTWHPATLAADGAVIYNASKLNKILAILAFGFTRCTDGHFTVELFAPWFQPSKPNDGLITITPQAIYGPGERAIFLDGLTVEDMQMLLMYQIGATQLSEELSPAVKMLALSHCNRLLSDLHHRYDIECDHGSSCPYPKGQAAQK